MICNGQVGIHEWGLVTNSIRLMRSGQPHGGVPFEIWANSIQQAYLAGYFLLGTNIFCIKTAVLQKDSEYVHTCMYVCD